MESSEAKTPSQSISSVSFIAVMLKGWCAFQEVKNLKTAIWKTFLINYTLFLGIMILLNGIVYLYALRPLVDTVFGSGEGGVAAVGNVLLWGTQLVIAAIFALAALRFSIVLMSMWHENLVGIVIRHFRALPNFSFSIADWLKTLKQTIVTALKEMFVFLLLIILGFLPGIGLILVFLAGAYLVGKDIFTPYLNVLQEHKEPVKELRHSLRRSAFILGASQMLLALIPFVGWLLMPLMMIYQMIGLTYAVEETRK